jgi:hypothetical protein
MNLYYVINNKKIYYYQRIYNEGKPTDQWYMLNKTDDIDLDIQMDTITQFPRIRLRR